MSAIDARDDGTGGSRIDAFDRRTLIKLGAGVVITRAIWGNLHEVKDIGEAIRTLASFGNPMAL